ncbi:DUF2970 domain-containing protein [Comamonas sp. GB3 AK4-5]|uniref:DUF2970 domain-containing protein n=1 Tax=Comamonas sp. GB3 AK4-5 TaxID=3231487 RepID=UPI00351DD995
MNHKAKAELKAEPENRAWWRSIKAVAWAMLGVRDGGEYQRDFAQLHPLQVIAIGLVAIFALVLGLIALVHWMV